MADYWLQNKPALANAFRQIKKSTLATASATATAAATAAASRQPRPERPEILLYPSYSSLCPRAELPYSITLRGWLFVEGDPNKRRNKLLVATAERFIGGEAPHPEIKEELHQLIELEPELTAAPAPEAEPAPEAAPHTIRQRLAPFFRKPLAVGSVEVTLTGEKGERVRASILTDAVGRFEHTCQLPFAPHRVTARHTSAAAAQPCESSIHPAFIGPSGVSVISDIDDTIRLTGILAGKRDTLRNVLANPYDQVKLEGVAEWYRQMQHRGAAFHYVSNSPWQLFDTIYGFLRSQRFPAGSIHLKRYQGIIDGIFEPVANRKTKSLEQIFRDFPNRKFILVGDGGELDLETYVQTATKFPRQVLAIYIRDLILPQDDPLELEDPLGPGPGAEVVHSEYADRDLIDLWGDQAPGGVPAGAPTRPPKSTKPGKAHWRQFEPAAPAAPAAPPRPAAPHINWPKAEAELTQPTVGGVAGALLGASSRRGAAVEAANIFRDQLLGKKPPPAFVSSSQDYSEYERLDKERRRIDNWKSRIIEAKRSLPIGIDLKMWRTPADVESSALKKISGEPDLL